MKRHHAAVVVAVGLCAARAGAPPPVGDFPAELAPHVVTAPLNTKLWAFGRAAPDVDAVGFAARENDDNTITLTPTRLGCCAVVASGEFVAGTVVDVLVSTAGAERTARFTVGAVDDALPPTLTSVGIIDASGGGLVLGAEGTDDRGLAGFIARSDGVVVAGPVDKALVIAGARCVDVVAVDLAGLESAAREVCAPDVVDAGPDVVDAGPDVIDAGPDDDDDDDEPVDDASCAAGARGSLWSFAVVLLFVRRRSRR